MQNRKDARRKKKGKSPARSMRTATHSMGMGEFSGASGSILAAERSEEVSRLVQNGIALAASNM